MSTEQKTGERERAKRFALRNWRVPTRLTALILAPTLIAVILAGIRVTESVDSIAANERTLAAAEYAARLRDLSQQLATERDRTAWVDGLIGVRASLRDPGRVIQQQEYDLNQQKATVDRLLAASIDDVKQIDESYGERAAEEARQTLSRLEVIADSHAAERDKDAATSVFFDYGQAIATILRLHDELGEISDDPQVVAASRALSALAHAKDEASQQRAVLTTELLEPRQAFTPDDLQRFLGSWSRQAGYTTAFNAEADTAAFTAFYKARSVPAARDVEMTKAWAVALGSRNHALRPIPGRVITAQEWFKDNTAALEALKGVEQQVADQVLGRASALQSAEQRSALIAGGLILALILLVLATTVLIARSMVRPLRRLRAEALEIAGIRLPEVVRRMREAGEPQQPADDHSVTVDSADEIGEVAQAFDEVHQQAVRLAAEESQLRNNVNAMFVNLSRRTQTLVERQISLIDGLERGEQDGTRLADLFKLDHLATRMRRNSENLLVLAGHEPARKRSQPARLVDVVRASLSEVEGYERVTVRVHRSAAVAGHAANDVVHLVAELVENAVAFSSRDTKVIVSSSPIEGGAVLLAVSDTGIGLSPEEIMEINRRLAEPPTVDVSVSRRMGLFVVGRLAQRHGIRVQLRPGDVNGLIAMVLFPAELIANPDAKPVATGYGEVPAWPTPAAIEPTGAFHTPTTTSGLPVRRPVTPQEPPRHAPREMPREPASSNGWSAFGAPPRSPGRPEPAGEVTASFPAFTEHSGAFPVLGAPSYEPRAESLERGDEYLPIFASVESAWFRRPDPKPPVVPPQSMPPQGVPMPGVPPQSAWRSSADTGYRAAAAANEPAAGGVTPAGLPRRTPRANLVPGSVNAASSPPATAPPVSPEAVRDRFSSFQQGVRRGRAEAAGESADGSANEREGS
ncbi:nitrate- and nitrite sensing domain-containing protein [Acrocarpospora sp. B8E8]|uniref:sensor histidine kinase n=1 Tax=Acrocarpospora sp. B8E8 TaxID=3153572 RepID=UPI00325C5AFA